MISIRENKFKQKLIYVTDNKDFYVRRKIYLKEIVIGNLLPKYEYSPVLSS